MKKVILSFSIVLFHCEDKDSTNILMTTEIGTITIELLLNQAPITVKKILRYIDEDRYSDFILYRVLNMKNQNSDSVKIEVIQGGLGFNQHPNVLPPLSHESTNKTDLKHLNGTISLSGMNPVVQVLKYSFVSMTSLSLIIMVHVILTVWDLMRSEWLNLEWIL